MKTAICQADLPPAERLDRDPVVSSLADVDRALAELSWLDSREATVNAACEARCGLLRIEAAGKLRIKAVDDEAGESIAFADRRAVLETAIREYCEAEKETLLESSDKKSLDLTHGKIGWKSTQLTIGPVKGSDAGGVLKVIDKACDLAKKIVALLGRVKFAGVPLGSLIKLNPSLSMTAIKQAHEQKKLTPATLKKLGLEVHEPTDKFYHDVAKWPVASVEEGGRE